MALDLLKQIFSDKAPVPNNFTIDMGKLIKKAREEVGMSQVELCELIYRRQTSLSDMEHGKMEVDSGTLALIADALRKPISYFYPWDMYHELTPEVLAPLEEEALENFREIRGDNLQKLAIQIIRVFRHYDPEALVDELTPFYNAKKEQRQRVKAMHEKQNKGKN